MAHPAIRMIGELALRVDDLEAMRTFYEEVIGLEVYGTIPEAVFFVVGEGVPGHPQVLALFDRGSHPQQDRSTLDHFAFAVDRADQDAEQERLHALGIPTQAVEFPVFGWRGLFFFDPEGNTIELVAVDPSLRTPEGS
jgi:catechol-2,3-dioxygenase